MYLFLHGVWINTFTNTVELGDKELFGPPKIVH